MATLRWATAGGPAQARLLSRNDAAAPGGGHERRANVLRRRVPLAPSGAVGRLGGSGGVTVVFSVRDGASTIIQLLFLRRRPPQLCRRRRRRPAGRPPCHRLRIERCAEVPLRARLRHGARSAERHTERGRRRRPHAGRAGRSRVRASWRARWRAHGGRAGGWASGLESCAH